MSRIQARFASLASARRKALIHGTGLSDVLKFVVEFRKQDAATPIVLMGYANPIEAMGSASFLEKAKAADIDGVIVVDYPPEECVEFSAVAKKNSIDPVFLLAPTSTEKRIEEVARIGSGFGIRDAESARRVAETADAVVIGSRIIQEIESAEPRDATSRVKALLKPIRQALDA